jgi:hypothetical protein
MPQHCKITARKVGELMDLLEHANQHDIREAGADLFWLLPQLDSFLVKHDRTDTARSLRRAFDKFKDGV